jgi:hypothetical protein
MIESLVSLEEQYEHMRSLSKSNRQSVKRSLVNVKGVPHTTITLKPKASHVREHLTNASFTSTTSRVHSFSGS